MDGPVDRLHTVVYTALSYVLSLPKGANVSIAQRPPSTLLCVCARIGSQQKMNGRLFGDVRVSVASYADTNNLESQRRVLAGCEQIFEN